MITLIKIVLFLCIIGCVVLGLTKFDEKHALKFGPNKKMALTLIPIVLLVLVNCVVIIPANNVGIKWSAISGTSQNVLNEGLGFKSPVDKVYLIDTTVHEIRFTNVTVQTKDAQYLDVEGIVKFKVDKANAFKIYTRYVNVENLSNSMISYAAQKSIEKVCTQYGVIEALGSAKNEIYEKIEDELSAALKIEGVDLVDIILLDMDAGEDIERAIAQEAVAKKEVETALQLKEKAQIEAETKAIEAEGQAKANEILSEELTDAILKNKWLEKWDGKLPIVSGDNYMIDLNGLLGN